jgi:predicted P-loop ATPase
VQLYRDGVPWWPDKDFEHDHIAPEQAARYEGDAWEGPVGEHLKDETQTTLIDIACDALGYEEKPPEPSRHGEQPPVRGTPINRFGTSDQRRVMAILTMLGWKRGKRDSTGRRLWDKNKSQ